MNLTSPSSRKWMSFHSCHQGASHIKADKVCQDAAYSCYRKGDHFALAIVSDGHGSNNYFRSDRGSKMAIKATRKSVVAFMKNFFDGSKKDLYDDLFLHPDSYMRQLESNIIYNWRKLISKDYTQYPFKEEEKALMSADALSKFEASPEERFVKAYGATLIAVVIFPGRFWFGLHIGDGKCVAHFADGHFEQPIPWDDKCFLNTTTSLCGARPLENFRHCFHTDNFPEAIFLGSDGVDDSFSNDNDLYEFYKEVERTFREKNYDDALAELDTFLPEMSSKGSGDDISVSGIIRIE